MSYHQRIYNRLRREGMTEAGALGVLGNWQAESGCEPNRRQGDFSPSRSASKDYTAKFMSGVYGKAQFVNDTVGYGLAQWTLGKRQAELYDFWKQSGKALDDLDMQLDFALKEFKRDFIADWRLLCSTSDIYEATKAVCYRFENPLKKNVDTRFQEAQRLKYEIDLNAWEGEGEVTEVVVMKPGWEKIPATEYWPPRMIDNGMNGDDVMVLQAILKARGYAVTEVDGQFGSYLDQIVRDFQEGHGLTVDGVVGPMTWAALLNRG